MVVFVHNASLRPLKSDQIFIETGKRSLISVKRTFVNNVNSPYTPCQDLSSYSSPLYDFIINSHQYSTYRQKDCFNLCIQESIIAACNCSYSGIDNPYGPNSTIQPCLSLSDYTCYNRIFYEFDPNECASNSCPLECQSVEYDLSVSSLADPSLSNYLNGGAGYGQFCCFFYWLCPQGQYILNECSCSNACFDSLINFTAIDYETFKNYFVTFYVYYPSLTFTQLETTPAMAITDLLSNLGGSMGLIVSVSVFTLVEITELFVLILNALLFKKTNKVLESK